MPRTIGRFRRALASLAARAVLLVLLLGIYLVGYSLLVQVLDDRMRRMVNPALTGAFVVALLYRWPRSSPVGKLLGVVYRAVTGLTDAEDDHDKLTQLKRWLVAEGLDPDGVTFLTSWVVYGKLLLTTKLGVLWINRETLHYRTYPWTLTLWTSLQRRFELSIPLKDIDSVRRRPHRFMSQSRMLVSPSLYMHDIRLVNGKTHMFSLRTEDEMLAFEEGLRRYSILTEVKLVGESNAGP